MNQRRREYAHMFLQELEAHTIIANAYLNDWDSTSFDFFVEVKPYDRDRYTTTRIKATINRVQRYFPGIIVNMYNYNTPRGGNGWKFNAIVS